MPSPRTYWNGEPARARKVTVVVADDLRFPLYWARAEGIVGQRIEAVEVYYPLDAQDAFYLDNRDGSAWGKVTEGMGAPRWGHRSVTIDTSQPVLEASS